MPVDANLAIHTTTAAALFLIETWQIKHPDVMLRKQELAAPG